jgi:aminomethyltransferase
MPESRQTPLYDRHCSLGASIVEFAGWDMPIMYPPGIIEEHLSTRRKAGLFDVSHMGRFIVKGNDASAFLQHVLTNNAEALDTREVGAQYTMIPNNSGGAVDDAYLYRFVEDSFLLVVNAANRDEDWKYLRAVSQQFKHLELTDQTEGISMLALQGPLSRGILEKIMDSGRPPEPIRNAAGIVTIAGRSVQVARTGYTGEPICYELFVPAEAAPEIWDLILKHGAVPVGLGARDTLRLEAGLPLYGHELGTDPEGKEIPIMACPLARFAVSFSPLKGDFVGRQNLLGQFEARARILCRDFSRIDQLPRLIRPLAVTGRGVARDGASVFLGDKQVGFVTSGTMVPYWKVEGSGLESSLVDSHALRGLCLAIIDAEILDEQELHIEVRGRMVEARVVPYHLRNDAPPYARPIVAGAAPSEEPVKIPSKKAQALIEETIGNTIWRQESCINLIPSEMTASPMVRLLSIMDPSFRYAEHRKARAFYDADIFYYQGTEFIARVEQLLQKELVEYLGCTEVETRMISGQMANTAVFSAMMQYINRDDPKREPRRIFPILNHHIGKGGHLSSQPMGALRDFVARDPRTERPAVVPFPVLSDNPYKVDVEATLTRIEEVKPRLIIFGKSMVLYKEPVQEVRAFLDQAGIDAVVLYDMAHVLGLLGRHFQQPFREGADLVTGSTHKTFFGPQRGIAASSFTEEEERYALWEAIEARTFPGSVSNHHLGTMLALLMASYEMNSFKDSYQPRVIENAKAFARALKDSGLDVAGDPADGFTETHQVIVNVGYGKGPEIAARLEKNNIICNYQATPDEEGFTASGALRMGVSEMTRFGMDTDSFGRLAGLIRDAIVDNADVQGAVKDLRSEFMKLLYCFEGEDFTPLMEKLHRLI